MSTVFWVAVGIVAYTYLAFPAVLVARAWLLPRPHREAAVTPQLSVVVAAYNEAAVIGPKLQALLTADYPPDLLEVIVVSDGSTDATADIVAACADPRVWLLCLPRGGKAVALNRGVALARGEVLVFSDANSIVAVDALRALVRPFADPEVGAVAGDQRYVRSPSVDGVSQGERRYWELDRLLKLAGSRAGSATSATGSLYAIRRELFEAVPEGVTDDFFVSTGAIVRGRRLVFAPGAIAYEPVAPRAGLELERKARVIARGLRGVARRRELLSVRRHGFFAVQLLSHKVLRRLVAVPLVVMAVTSAVLAPASAGFAAVAAVQAVFYATSLTALVAALRGRRLHPLMRLPAYFCLVNVAACLGAWRVLRGGATVRWEPRRTVELPAVTGRGPGR